MVTEVAVEAFHAVDQQPEDQYGLHDMLNRLESLEDAIHKGTSVKKDVIPGAIYVKNTMIGMKTAGAGAWGLP